MIWGGGIAGTEDEEESASKGHELPAETPTTLRCLLQRCLDKDVRLRRRDIGEARSALEDLRAGVAEAPAAAPPRAAPRSSLRRYGLPLASFAVVAAAAVLAWRLQAGRGSTALPLLKSGVVMSPDDTGIQGNFSPALSPGGRYLVYVSQNQLWLRDRAAVEPLALAGTEGAQRPFWSPDGEWIGFGHNQLLYKLPRVGGKPTLIAKLPNLVTLGNASNACWTEDDRIVIGSGTTGLFQASVQGGEATPLIPTGEGESDFHEVCALPGNRGYAFVVHNHKGIGQLDAATPDGKRRNLLQGDETLWDPVYSPSGHILFRRSGASDGIWALPFSPDRLEVTGEPFLVASGGVVPSTAADGSLSFVTGVHSQQAQLVWLGRDGAVLGTIGRPEATTRPYPSLSPDGKSVLLAGTFGDGRELFLYDVASGNRRRLTFNDLREDVGIWHPNGSDILFYETGTYKIHRLSVDGSSTSLVVANGIMGNLSPDGTQVFFARKKEGAWDWDVCVQPYQEGEAQPTELVATPAVDWWPAISPDGRTLLYVSDETGRDEVYATNFPRPTTRWQVSVDGGQWPRWRPDGREIYFTTHEVIFAVDVESGSGLTLGAPRRLFRRPSTNWAPQWADGFDVTPDGQRFLVLQPVRDENAGVPMIVVVQNWFAEFEHHGK